MPSLSYKSSFVDFVEEGLKAKPSKGKRIKRQTIRNFRKVPIKKGDTLHHFYGMRTKWCRKLGTSICTSVSSIMITQSLIQVSEDRAIHTITDPKLLDAFAFADGFEDWETMKRWWTLTHGEECLPFTGQLIKW